MSMIEVIIATEPVSSQQLLRMHAAVFGQAEFKAWLQAEKAARRRRRTARPQEGDAR